MRCAVINVSGIGDEEFAGANWVLETQERKKERKKRKRRKKGVMCGNTLTIHHAPRLSLSSARPPPPSPLPG